MHTGLSRIAATAVLSAAMALVATAPAGAIGISGHQKVVNEAAGKFKMKGDLLGKWKVTKFRTLDLKPVFRGKGEERFNGCLDLDRDKSCADEPSGKLFFKFRYWAIFDDDGQVQLGTCAHPSSAARGASPGQPAF